MMAFWITVLVTHFISDFLLQPREMAKNKSSSFYWLFLHGTITFISFIVALSFLFPFSYAVVFACLNALIHMGIDACIWRGYKYSVIKRFKKEELEGFEYWEDSWFYHTIGFDQMLHMLTFILVAYILS